MDDAVQLRVAAQGALALLAAARTGLERPVRQCPGWDAADLARHLGGILGWMAAVVSSGERVSLRTRDPVPRTPPICAPSNVYRVPASRGFTCRVLPGRSYWAASRSGTARAACFRDHGAGSPLA